MKIKPIDCEVLNETTLNRNTYRQPFSTKNIYNKRIIHANCIVFFYNTVVQALVKV
jgi:hypothetical protein